MTDFQSPLTSKLRDFVGIALPVARALSLVQLSAAAPINRHRLATAEFQRQLPCPATGNRSGGCNGYVIDLIKALASVGADDPGNMQRQAVIESKAKDSWKHMER